MSKTSDLIARREKALSSGIGHVHQIFAQKAKNAEIWDIEGKRFIDFSSGIGVVNTGHMHPKVKEAVTKQLDNFSHTCIHIVMYELYIEVAEKLNKLMPGPGAKKTLLMNSGSEAVENAVKVARKFTGRTGVIAFNGGFHGRTMMTMSMTGRVVPYKAGYGPFVPEVFHAPFPDERNGISIDDAINGLEQLFKSDIERERVAAFIIEPVQGEGGFRPVPEEFFKRIAKIAKDSGILLIADEIQCGFGRSGKMFVCEHYGIEPDLMTLAKGLAGGFPLSAVVGRAEIMDSAPPASLGGTYGGSPIACAAAAAVLKIMEDEDIPAKAQKIGTHMSARLKEMANKYDIIGEVRNIGALVAIELFEGEDRKTPSSAKAGELLALAREQGLILLSCGVDGNVIRFLMPLTIEKEILNEGLDIIDKCLEQIN